MHPASWTPNTPDDGYRTGVGALRRLVRPQVRVNDGRRLTPKRCELEESLQQYCLMGL
jgi:hypothetical protein